MAKKVVTLSALERFKGKVQSEINKKANASSVYAKSEVYTKAETQTYVSQRLLLELDANGDLMPVSSS